MITFKGNARSREYYAEWLAQHGTNYDLTISCQCTEKLPAGCLNIHYGILPHYRGCNPIYHSIMNGDTSGVTLHWTDHGWDTGNIIGQYIFPNHGLTADEVYDECEKRGKELLIAHIDHLCSGTPQGTGTYYYKKDTDFSRECRIQGVFFDPAQIKRVFATHFRGKQYPVIKIGGRDFELRAV